MSLFYWVLVNFLWWIEISRICAIKIKTEMFLIEFPFFILIFSWNIIMLVVYGLELKLRMPHRSLCHLRYFFLFWLNKIDWDERTFIKYAKCEFRFFDFLVSFRFGWLNQLHQINKFKWFINNLID